MDTTGQAQSVSGTDAEVTRAIILLRTLSGFDGFNFNPQAVIKAVNYLHSLGFERSLKVLDFFSQAADNFEFYFPENVLLLSRILYNAKNQEEALPRLVLGTPDIKEPRDPGIFPIYPLYLQQDLPLLLVGGYISGGEAEPPIKLLDWYFLHGRLRPIPLQPQGNPLVSVDEFIESKWRHLNSDLWHAGMLRLQALRAVTQFIHYSKDEERALLSASTSDSAWFELKRRVEGLIIAWDPETDEFTVNPS